MLAAAAVVLPLSFSRFPSSDENGVHKAAVRSVSSCLELNRGALSAYGAGGEDALRTFVQSSYSSDENGEVQQPYVIQMNVTDARIAMLVMHPFLTVPAEDSIAATFWLLNEDAGKGDNLLEAIAEGRAPGGLFTSQGEFDTSAGEIVSGHRKSYITQAYRRLHPRPLRCQRGVLAEIARVM